MFFNNKTKKNIENIVFYRDEDWKEDLIKDYLYHNSKSTLIRSENKIETIIDVNRKENFTFFLLNNQNLRNFLNSSYIRASVNYIYFQEKLGCFSSQMIDFLDIVYFRSCRVIHNYQGLKIENGRSYDIKDYYEIKKKRRDYPFI